MQREKISDIGHDEKVYHTCIWISRRSYDRDVGARAIFEAIFEHLPTENFTKVINYPKQKHPPHTHTLQGKIHLHSSE